MNQMWIKKASDKDQIRIRYGSDKGEKAHACTSGFQGSWTKDEASGMAIRSESDGQRSKCAAKP